MDLRTFIRDVPDFPKPGIMFKDISPLLASPAAFRASVEGLVEIVDAIGAVDRIAAIESRGFLFGAGLAQAAGIGLCPVRKPGKLPWKTHRQEYELEYGTDALEIHVDALEPGERVLVVDDLLATGGTAGATVALLEGIGATVVGAAFVVELAFLEGRNALGTTPVHSILTYN